MNFSYTNPAAPPGGAAGDMPPEWAEIGRRSLSGLIMVAGGPDSGKSTLVQHLSRRFLAGNGQVAEVDADPGQSRLGPPATFTLRWIQSDDGRERQEKSWQRFVGSVSPTGHMIQVL